MRECRGMTGNKEASTCGPVSSLLAASTSNSPQRPSPLLPLSRPSDHRAEVSGGRRLLSPTPCCCRERLAFGAGEDAEV